MSDDRDDDNVVDFKKQAKKHGKNNIPESEACLLEKIAKLEKTIKTLRTKVPAGTCESWLVDYFTSVGNARREGMKWIPADLAIENEFPVFFYNYDSKSSTRILLKENNCFEEISQEKLAGLINQDLRRFAVDGEKYNVYARTQAQTEKLARRLMSEGRRIKSWPLPSGFKSQEGNFFYRHDFDPVPDGTLENCPFISQVLDRMSDPRAFCLRVGSLFDYECDRKQALILYGPSDGGKGSILRLLEFIVGQSGVASVTADEFSSSFGMESLVDKRLIVLDEADKKFWNSNAFKAYTGRTSHLVNPKGEKKYNAEMHGLIVAATNPAPEVINDPSIINRLILIYIKKFEGKILSEAEVDLYYRQELPEFLGYCISLYQQLKASGSTRIDCDHGILDEVIADNESTEKYLFDLVFEIDMELDLHNAILTAKDFQECWEKLCRDHPDLAGRGKDVTRLGFQKYVKSLTGRVDEPLSESDRRKGGVKDRFIPFLRKRRY